MSGASVETVLELWASSLRDAKARIGSMQNYGVCSGLDRF